MNPKYEITKIVLNFLELDNSEEKVKSTIPIWFVSSRNKARGGMQLTDQGFEALSKAEIKFYEIRLEEPITYNNEMVIWLDRNINCPFYLLKNKIYVSSEKMAIQLVLFSGNIDKFKRAQQRFEKIKTH